MSSQFGVFVLSCLFNNTKLNPISDHKSLDQIRFDQTLDQSKPEQPKLRQNKQTNNREKLEKSALEAPVSR